MLWNTRKHWKKWRHGHEIDKRDQKFEAKLLLKQLLSKRWPWYSNYAIRISLNPNVEDILEHKLGRGLEFKG